MAGKMSNKSYSNNALPELIIANICNKSGGFIVIPYVRK